jgi:hypothetical protein
MQLSCACTQRLCVLSDNQHQLGTMSCCRALHVCSSIRHDTVSEQSRGWDECVGRVPVAGRGYRTRMALELVTSKLVFLSLHSYHSTKQR